MDRRKLVTLTNLCMITKGDEILVIDRQKKDWPGITFPGGHVEDDESIVDSVIREVKEETGLDIQQPKLCGITLMEVVIPYFCIHAILLLVKLSLLAKVMFIG